MWVLPQKQNARRADKIRLYGHLRRYKKIVKKTYIICYNFHDLNSKLDIGQALKSPYRNRKKNLYEQVDEILERRHGLIHRLEIDYDYRTYNLQGDIDDVIIAIKRTYCYICNSYGWEKKELSL